MTTDTELMQQAADALKTLHDKTAEMIAHLQATGRMRPCFNLPALATADAALAALRSRLDAPAQAGQGAPSSAIAGWTLNHAQQLRPGVWEVGYLDDEDDRFSPVITVDTGLYYRSQDAAPLARAIVAALAASPSAQTQAAVVDEDCAVCGGDGTIRAETTDRGEDDYDYEAECSACGGTGLSGLKAAIEALPYFSSQDRPAEGVERAAVLRILAARAQEAAPAAAEGREPIAPEDLQTCAILGARSAIHRIKAGRPGDALAPLENALSAALRPLAAHPQPAQGEAPAGCEGPCTPPGCDVCAGGAPAAGMAPAQGEAAAWYVRRVAPGFRDDGMKLGPFWKREQAEEWCDDRHVLCELFDAPAAGMAGQGLVALNRAAVMNGWLRQPEGGEVSKRAFEAGVRYAESLHGIHPAGDKPASEGAA